MKIALFDQDIQFAAELGLMLKKALGKTAKVNYYDSLSDKEIGDSNIMIADPAPQTTVQWLAEFRSKYPKVVLLLISNNSDLLSGSFKDASYAMSKPPNYQEVVYILKHVMLGKIYTAGGFSTTDKVSN